MRNSIGISLLAGVLALAACGPETFDTAAEDTDLAPGVTLGFESETTVSLLSSTIVELATTAGSSTSSTSTTAASISTTTTSTVASAAPVACTTDDPPAGRRQRPVNIDVDGDGVDEIVYVIESELVRSIIVEFDNGQYITMPVEDEIGGVVLRVVGGAPLRGDASEDILFSMSNNSIFFVLGFARADGCELERLTREDGSPALFFAKGLDIIMKCSVGSVEQSGYPLPVGEDDQGNQLFEGGFTYFNLDGKRFIRSAGGLAVISLEEKQALSSFDCFGLRL